MPFTLCHPAIVLPLHRYARRITCLPALVIGSMMPDFVYFFSFGVSGGFSHSVPGIALYCVPVGAALLLLYHALRPALLAWLPPALSARMAWQVPLPLHSVRAASVVIASLALGAATHIIWDSFTHPDTLFVSRFALLRTVVPLGGYHVPVFKILQHASSLAGLTIIASFSVAWFSRSVPGRPYQPSFSKRQRLSAVAAVSAASVLGGACGLLFKITGSHEHAIFNMVTMGMASGAAAIVLVCAAWTALASIRQRS